MFIIARNSRDYPLQCGPMPHLTQKENRPFLRLPGLLDSFAVALTLQFKGQMIYFHT